MKNKCFYKDLIITAAFSIFIVALQFFVYRCGFSYYTNDGISFGLSLQGYEFVFMLIFILLMLSILVFSQNRYSRMGMIFIISGGIANFIDRLLAGGVGDYFKFLDLWYFNTADLFIFVGACLLVYFGVWRSKG